MVAIIDAMYRQRLSLDAAAGGRLADVGPDARRLFPAAPLAAAAAAGPVHRLGTGGAQTDTQGMS